MDKLILRSSRVTAIDRCAYSAHLQYGLNLVPKVKSATMEFGTAIHKPCTDYIQSQLTGAVIDLRSEFLKSWYGAAKHPLRYSQTASFEKFKATGLKLVEDFPEKWDMTGLVPLVINGKPAVELTLFADIGEDIVLQCTVDTACLHIPTGMCAATDLKTCAAAHSEQFGATSDQLTHQQICLLANGVEVQKIGFMDLIKRTVKPVKRLSRSKKPQLQPEVMMPQHYSARSAEEVNRYIDKCKWLAESIRANRYPRRSSINFDSPCSDCDYFAACNKNDFSGLVRIPVKQLNFSNQLTQPA